MKHLFANLREAILENLLKLMQQFLTEHDGALAYTEDLKVMLLLLNEADDFYLLVDFTDALVPDAMSGLTLAYFRQGNQV